MAGQDPEVKNDMVTMERFHLKGGMVEAEGGELEKSKMFDMFELDLDDYTDLTFSLQEMRRMRMHMMNMKTGVQAMAPLLCCGPKRCAFAKRCPLVDRTLLTADGEIDLERQPGTNFPLGRQCLPGDTKIYLANGETKVIRDIVTGDEVLSVDVSTHHVRSDVVSGKINNGYRDVYRICTRSGHEVEVTSDHPLWAIQEKLHRRNGSYLKKYERTINNVEHKWCSIDGGLSVGDKVAVLDCIPHEPLKVLPEGLPEFLGYFLGDGCYSFYNADFVNTNYLYIQEFLACCHKLGAKKTRVDKFKVKPNRKQAWLVRVSNHDRSMDPCRQYLKDNGLYGITGPQKRIPKDIFGAGPGQIRLFLNRFWAADGYVSVLKQEGVPHRVEIGTLQENIDLVRDVQRLLLLFGVHSKIRTERGKKRYNYRLLIRHFRSVNNFLHAIGPIYGKEEACRKALAFIETSSDRADQREGDIKWDHIQSIECVGKKEVFDLQVDNDHNFIANEFLVHNCFFEREFLNFKRQQYADEYDIDEESPTEMGMVNRLAVLDLYEYRLMLVLAHGDDNGEGMDLMKVQVVGFSKTGDPLLKTEAHPAWTIREKINKERQDILEAMVGTRHEKYKKQAALKDRTVGDPSSQTAALADKIRQLEAQIIPDGVIVSETPAPTPEPKKE